MLSLSRTSDALSGSSITCLYKAASLNIRVIEGGLISKLELALECTCGDSGGLPVLVLAEIGASEVGFPRFKGVTMIGRSRV